MSGGAPPDTFKAMVAGQDSTNLYTPAFFFCRQPSVEAVEEVSLRTSNFAAEFGQAQGGIYNFTARSGANRYHGGSQLQRSAHRRVRIHERQ